MDKNFFEKNRDKNNEKSNLLNILALGCIAVTFLVIFAFVVGSKPEVTQMDTAVLDSKGIPTIVIETEDATARDIMADSKDIDLTGRCLVFNGDDEKMDELLLEKLASRGHRSFFQKKIGYALKFPHRVSLFDMGLAKNYVLFPGYRETSFIPYLLNNRIAKEIGWEYDVEIQPVQLLLNDEYMGLYVLSEKYEFSPYRIDLNEQKNFIVELANKDYYDEGQPDTTYKDIFRLEKDSFIIRQPSTINQGRRDEIIAFTEKALAAVEDEEEIWEYWDLDSVTDFAFSLFYNAETSIDASVYFLYDVRDGRFHVLPLWDLERSYKYNYSDKDYAYILEQASEFGSFYVGLLGNDEVKKNMRRKYEEVYKPVIARAPEFLVEFYGLYNEAMLKDEALYQEIDEECPLNVEDKWTELVNFVNERPGYMEQDILEW